VKGRHDLSFWEVLLVALALAMDALAVSVALGLSGRGSVAGCAARAAAAFGLFQAGMALSGWLGGRAVSGQVEEAGRWIAAAILVVVALRMLVEALRKRKIAAPSGAGRSGAAGPGVVDSNGALAADGSALRDASRGWALIALAVATSLDALGAGVGLAMVGARISIAAPVIGLVAACLSAAGVTLAGRLARGPGREARRSAQGGAVSGWAEFVGALVLLGIAARIALAS
jgi:putative Mn2+ efflux pump MntP